MRTRLDLLVSALAVLCLGDGLGGQATSGFRTANRPPHQRQSHRPDCSPYVTLDEARRSVPSATFRRAADGDGAGPPGAKIMSIAISPQ